MGRNCAKSHEVVFRSRRLRGKADQPAPPCSGIERVDKQTILGVVVNSRLTATDHISYLLDSCSSLLHALRVLRTHGLPSQSLKDVFHATYRDRQVDLLRASMAWILLGLWVSPLQCTPYTSQISFRPQPNSDELRGGIKSSNYYTLVTNDFHQFKS